MSPQRIIRITKFGKQAPNTVPMAAILGKLSLCFFFFNSATLAEGLGPLTLNICEPIYKTVLSIHTLNISVMK